MKLLDIIHDANLNLLRNKLRSFLTILAIFIGSFSIISTSAIQAGVNNFIDSQVESYGGDGYLAIVSKDSFDALEGLQGTIGSNSKEPIEYNPDKIQDGMTPITKEKIEELKKIDGIDADSIVEQKTLSISYVASNGQKIPHWRRSATSRERQSRYGYWRRAQSKSRRISNITRK